MSCSVRKDEKPPLLQGGKSRLHFTCSTISLSTWKKKKSDALGWGFSNLEHTQQNPLRGTWSRLLGPRTSEVGPGMCISLSSQERRMLLARRRYFGNYWFSDKCTSMHILEMWAHTDNPLPSSGSFLPVFLTSTQSDSSVMFGKHR